VVPSEPLTVICVAFVAATVRIDELPAAIDVGAAVIVTVGLSTVAPDTVTVTVAVADPKSPDAVAV